MWLWSVFKVTQVLFYTFVFQSVLFHCWQWCLLCGRYSALILQWWGSGIDFRCAHGEENQRQRDSSTWCTHVVLTRPLLKMLLLYWIFYAVVVWDWPPAASMWNSLCWAVWGGRATVWDAAVVSLRGRTSLAWLHLYSSLQNTPMAREQESPVWRRCSQRQHHSQGESFDSPQIMTWRIRRPSQTCLSATVTSRLQSNTGLRTGACHRQWTFECTVH